ncbi:MAG: DHH family phosphoesterase [Methanothrix sp.]|nr:DHH family phosphoesterase [Methanothrix sp.]
MRIPESEFCSQVKGFERVLYLCHRNADPDSIASAFALQQAFGGDLGAVDDLSRTGRALADAIGAKVTINPIMEEYDLVVIVDTSVQLQLGGLRPKCYAVIDHHMDEGLLRDALFYIQRPSPSTAEIVWRILKESGSRPKREAALGLLAGIVSDTGRFKRASPEAFRAAAELLEAGSLEYGDALLTLHVPVDISQRVAVLKAASRAEVDRIGSWLIATTEINSFEGSAAMALVEIGADVAFAAGRHEGHVRISARAGREAVLAGLSLADLLREVAEAHGGEGGGHQAAAAMEAAGGVRALLEECKRRAAEVLS